MCIYFLMESLTQESGGNVAKQAKILASYKCEKNSARDFGNAVPLPLELSLHFIIMNI